MFFGLLIFLGILGILWVVLCVAEPWLRFQVFCPRFITPVARFNPQTDQWVEGAHMRSLPSSDPLAKVTIMVCHGNAGNVDMWADTLSFLLRDFHLAIYDYSYITEKRAVSSWEQLREEARRVADLVTGPKHYMGISLGGMLATDLWSRDTDEGAKLALLCPLLNPDCVVKVHTKNIFSKFTEATPAWTIPGHKDGSLVRMWHGTRDTLVPCECNRHLVREGVGEQSGHVDLLHDREVRHAVMGFLL